MEVIANVVFFLGISLRLTFCLTLGLPRKSVNTVSLVVMERETLEESPDKIVQCLRLIYTP